MSPHSQHAFSGRGQRVLRTRQLDISWAAAMECIERAWTPQYRTLFYYTVRYTINALPLPSLRTHHTATTLPHLSRFYLCIHATWHLYRRLCYRVPQPLPGTTAPNTYLFSYKHSITLWTSPASQRRTVYLPLYRISLCNRRLVVTCSTYLYGRIRSFAFSLRPSPSTMDDCASI